MAIEVGSVLCGKYRLEASIGKGGMGEVFSATDLAQNGQRVAIKVVNRSVLGDLLVQRLYREAMAAARVRSDYVPQLLDVARDDNGELFLVMELLDGETLGDRIRRVGGVLEWSEVQSIGEHMLLGLIDAHAAGVIHRDLKPGNIFLSDEVDTAFGRERARILDFGVCKLDTNEAEHLTTTGEALGTIAYMAPEQIRGASKVDERADLYAWGMVIFEALSGRLPHDGSGQMAMIASKLERAARNLKDFCQVAVPQGLDTLIGKTLARKQGDRYASAQEVLRAWRALGPATVLPRATAVSNAAMPNLTHNTQTAMTAGTHTPGASVGSRLGLALAGAALVGAFALLGFVLFGHPRARAAELPIESPPSASAYVTVTPPDTLPSPPMDDPAAIPAMPAPIAPIAQVTPDPSAEPLDLDDSDGDAAPPLRTTRLPPRVVHRPPRQPPPPTPTGPKKSTGPHIQQQPRY